MELVLCHVHPALLHVTCPAPLVNCFEKDNIDYIEIFPADLQESKARQK